MTNMRKRIKLILLFNKSLIDGMKRKKEAWIFAFKKTLNLLKKGLKNIIYYYFEKFIFKTLY